MEHRLLSLWQEILGIDGLGVEDDYFALGGSSLMAARLFAEIARRFAVRLPLSTILEAPTVRTLSHHLERKRSSPAGSLVDLRPGGPRTLFIVHDGVGETLLYLNLARRLPTDFAVVGIGPRRLPGIPLAHTRVEDMAAFYLVEIRKKQAHGPYFLAGMCAGGVIAYEMAAQLLDAGESVELVALFDAVTPQATKRTRPIVEQRPGPVKRELAELNESKLLARDNGWPGFVPELGFQKILSRAQAQYLPKPLSISSILLVRATSGEGADTPYTKLYVDDTLGWAAVAKNLAIADVDGGHESMLQESFVGSLASALTPYVEKKSARPRPRVVEPTTT
jgi:thioesterase domain-containing protein/acyl carrier protein